MEDFDRDMNGHQVRWRRKYLQNQAEGTQNGKKRPWILPRELWKEGLWAGIRSGKNSLPSYLDNTGVQKHDGAHNLKSSWIQCANLYFAFREDLDTLAAFLQKRVSPLISTVNRIELEWAEQSPLDPTTLLGEPHGQRGRNQTSPDVAFIVNAGKGIVLTENKFTEHSFYPCSGRKKMYGNPDINRCMNPIKVYNDTANQCYLLEWADGDRTNRKYWDYLRFSRNAFNILRRCPAANAGYQLFRQQALAEALSQRGPYDFVISCVAYDARNQVLLECLKSTGLRSFTTDWGFLFEGKARFAAFTHQQWVEWVSNNKRGIWQDWLNYVNKRYAL
jgi:hypothetical protein